MKKYLIVILVLIFSVLDAKDYKLFYLGGQSNMQGFGSVSELPSDLPENYKDIMIFNGNWDNDDKPVSGVGIWENMKPGFGYGSRSDGITNTYSERFGPELGFAIKIRELMPDENIAILKYAKGGTSIEIGASRWGCWDPDYSDSTGINQWDHFLASVRNAMAVKDIDGDGEEDRLIPVGIVWMQGESDADNSEETAKKYGANLRRLMDMIRAAFRYDDIPVVIGQIADSGNDEKDGAMMDNIKYVWEGEFSFVENDPAAAIVTSTQDYNFVDDWHFGTEGALDLGYQFAEKMFGLLQK